MTAAVIILAGALAAAIGGLIAFGSWTRTAQRECADARVDAAQKAGKLAVALADVKTWTAAAARERTRADGLDEVLDQVALNGDVDGARARVLARMQAAELSRGDAAADPNATGGDGAGAVPADGAAAVASGAG